MQAKPIVQPAPAAGAEFVFTVPATLTRRLYVVESSLDEAGV